MWNREILGIARDAALMYQENGDTCLARMAYDVFDVYMQGIYYRHMPKDMRNGGTQGIVGLTTFEVIHEDAIKETTALYALLKDYIRTKLGKSKDFSLYDAAFKKWAQVIIDNGVPNNNWNLIQAELIAKISMVLGDDKDYADGRGRQYYQNFIVNESSERQWALARLAGYGFDDSTYIWNESPGYSVNVVNEFAELANHLDRDAGVDLFDSIPVLQKAVMASAQYLMPNRMICGFGDTHPNYLKPLGAESVMSYAKRRNFSGLYCLYDSLARALTPTASAVSIERYVSPSFYVLKVSWLAMRSGMDAQHDLLASINGSLGNHQHANGISLELYGKGYVLAPDAGIGSNLYSGADYREYYSQFPAHNTVCVNGKSSYRVMLSEHPFEVLERYPSENTTGVFCAEQGDTCQLCRNTFAVVAFREPATNADQQRTVGIVKTSRKGGYYVDVFRSKVEDMSAAKQYHDYFYHDLGQKMEVLGACDQPLHLVPFENFAELNGDTTSSEKILKAYSWIKDKKSQSYKGDVKVIFTTHCREGRDICMRMWMKGEKNRHIRKEIAEKKIYNKRVK